jgi:hypothetical protein
MCKNILCTEYFCPWNDQFSQSFFRRSSSCFMGSTFRGPSYHTHVSLLLFLRRLLTLHSILTTQPLNQCNPSPTFTTTVTCSLLLLYTRPTHDAFHQTQDIQLPQRVADAKAAVWGTCMSFFVRSFFSILFSRYSSHLSSTTATAVSRLLAGWAVGTDKRCQEGINK